MKEFIPWALSGLNLLLFLLTFIRAGRWKDGADAQHLIDRVDKVESRLDVAENRLTNCATKEDTARIEGELTALGRDIGIVRNGVVRIENHLMGRAAA